MRAVAPPARDEHLDTARRLSAAYERIKEQMGRVIIGQTDVIDLMMLSLFCQGHAILEGVPGTAKTLLVQSFAAALSLAFGRIQFTPDLMPGDVLGTNLFNFQTNRFNLTKGPIFTQLLLAANHVADALACCLPIGIGQSLGAFDP